MKEIKVMTIKPELKSTFIYIRGTPEYIKMMHLSLEVKLSIKDSVIELFRFLAYKCNNRKDDVPHRNH